MKKIFTIAALFIAIATKAQIPSYVPLGNLQAFYSFDNEDTLNLKTGSIFQAFQGYTGGLPGEVDFTTWNDIDRFNLPNNTLSRGKVNIGTFTGTSNTYYAANVSAAFTPANFSLSFWVNCYSNSTLSGSQANQDNSIIFLQLGDTLGGISVNYCNATFPNNFSVVNTNTAMPSIFTQDEVFDTTCYNCVGALPGTTGIPNFRSYVEHIVITKTGSIFKLYINGVLQIQAVYNGFVFSTNNLLLKALQVNSCYAQNNRKALGIDEIAIYDAALSTTAIDSLYHTCSFNGFTQQPTSAQIETANYNWFKCVATGNYGVTYQWQENSGGGFANITNNATYYGATTDSLTIISPASSMVGYQYQCLVSADVFRGNCTYTSNTAILTPLGTGIKTLSANNEQITIYPNPSSGSLQVTYTSNIDELKVSNMLGQVVYEAKPNTKNTTLQLDNAGIYFITLTSGIAVKTQKIIINN